jgi:cell division protein FtsB
MTFDAATANAQLDTSLSAVALLNASCQAVVEAEIQPVQSDWYGTLDQQLGTAETLVLGWRRGGALYFGSGILASVTAYGSTFTAARPQVDAAFAALENDFSVDGLAALVAMLKALEPPLASMESAVQTYLAQLATFEDAMLAVQEQMSATVAQVQAQEAEIQAQITAINATIAALDAQVQTDRAAIAKARSAETTGIVETIFGVLLAPITGGASLILAGIGVASIAGAQELVDQLESAISGYQTTIANDQANLTQDQQTVATLNGLTSSTQLVLDDIGSIGTALDALRTTWTLFGGELTQTVSDLGNAQTAAVLVVAQAWFDAACDSWAAVVAHANALAGLPVSTARVQIG